jgi:hypothetical protein
MMPNIELAEMLVALIESVKAPPESGLLVTEAELDVPLEVTGGERRGELIIFGSVPHSRWKAGVLPPAHMGRLRIELVDDATPRSDDRGPRPWAADGG